MIAPYTADLHISFLLFSLLSWSGFFILTGTSEDAGREIVFALAVTLTSLVSLRVLGYFNRLKLRPRKSDLLLVLLSQLATCAFHLLIMQIAGIAPQINFALIILASALLSIVIFAAHYATSAYVLSQRRPRKVMLDLLPTEAVRIIADFASLGVDRFIEFLSAEELPKYLHSGKEDQISMIIISQNAVSDFRSNSSLLRAHLSGIRIVDFLKASADLTGRVRTEDADLWSFITGAKRQTGTLRAYSVAKIVIEPVIAVILAIILSPLMLLIAVAIKLFSPGPIFYRQERAGYLGHPFTLIKFRSMRIGAERDGAQWSHFRDERITALGKFLRATRLDELPQLWNVMNGEMSFFGPRPERPEMYEKLQGAIPLFSLRTLVRPGITGWAQVCAGYASSVEESKRKLEFDLYYIQHMSPRLDAIILIKTFGMFIPRSRIISIRTEGGKRYARAV